MFDNIVLSEVNIARKLHEESLPMYEMLRKIYQNQKEMDKDKSMIIDTICKGYGDSTYLIVERHKNKNYMLNKRQIQKRNKNQTKQETFDALLDEKIYNSIMQMSTEKYMHIRKYAFVFHKLDVAEFTQLFMDEFMETFLGLV
jgi:hypothetical protein